MDDSSRNRLRIPLHPILLEYTRREHPDIGPIVVSTIEYTVKESRNHYHDVMRSLEPLLKEKTKAFVDRLFMFRRKMCREGAGCTLQYCLFAHNDSELAPQRRVTFDLGKKSRNETTEFDNITTLLQEQEDIINRLSASFSHELLASLKKVTARIRRHIAPGEEARDQNDDVEASAIESSLYYSMLSR